MNFEWFQHIIVAIITLNKNNLCKLMKAKKMENIRVRYIDIAKGISVLCIILGHWGNSNINRVVYTFHVPIFYLITGFFISDKRSIKEFIEVKFRTLIIPYILTCIIVIVLGTLRGWIISHDPTTALKVWSYASLYGAGDSYTSPFYIPAIGALWFLWATFWGSCFLRGSLNFNKYVRLTFVVCLFVVGYFSRGICWFPFSIQAGACSTLFMYIGYLLRNEIKTVTNISKEVRYFGMVFAVVTWFSFIKDFQSFWLVHCDIGRGIVDIWGSICACSIIILLSKVIDHKMKYISNFFLFFGKYSLIVLCVHTTDYFFPLWRIVGILVQHGMPESYHLLVVALAKIPIDLIIVYFLSKISLVRRLYGMKD